MKYVSIICCCVVLAAACKTAKPTGAAAALPPQGGERAAAQQQFILAVILRAWRNPGDTTVRFEVSEVIKKEGKLKAGQNDNSGNDYTVSFATDKEAAVATYTIQHPLDIWMESPGDNGTLETHAVKKAEAHISVRTNYRGEMKKIVIKRNGSNSDKAIVLPLNIK